MMNLDIREARGKPVELITHHRRLPETFCLTPLPRWLRAVLRTFFGWFGIEPQLVIEREYRTLDSKKLEHIVLRQLMAAAQDEPQRSCVVVMGAAQLHECISKPFGAMGPFGIRDRFQGANCDRDGRVRYTIYECEIIVLPWLDGVCVVPGVRTVD